MRRALAALLLVAACSSGSTDATPSPTRSATASAAPTATSSPAQATGVVTRIDSRYGGRGRFSSPTGNLQCEIDRGSAACTIAEHDWTPAPPSYPGECTRDTAFASVELRRDGVVQRTDCYRLVDGNAPALPYGEGLEVDGVRCVSERAGVTCLDTTSREGFTVSRSALRLTPAENPTTRGTARQAAPGTLPAGFHVEFTVPSRNFTCLLESTVTLCSVGAHDWAVPPYDPQTQGGPCEFDRAPQVTVTREGGAKAYTECRSDVLADGPVLPYGSALQVGLLRCRSEKTGLSCGFVDGGPGFVVNRASFRTT